MSLGQTSVASLDVEGVTLSTVHTMKGQQAVVVFLVGMDEGTFPDYRAIKKGTIALKCNKRKITYMLQLLELKDIFIFVTLKKERCLGAIGLQEKI